MCENRTIKEVASESRAGFWHRPQVARLGLVVLVFGLLLWARFILVTGHPRTAVADPPAAQAHVASAASNAAHPHPARAAADAKP